MTEIPSSNAWKTHEAMLSSQLLTFNYSCQKIYCISIIDTRLTLYRFSALTCLLCTTKCWNRGKVYVQNTVTLYVISYLGKHRQPQSILEGTFAAWLTIVKYTQRHQRQRYAWTFFLKRVMNTISVLSRRHTWWYLFNLFCSWEAGRKEEGYNQLNRQQIIRRLHHWRFFQCTDRTCILKGHCGTKQHKLRWWKTWLHIFEGACCGKMALKWEFSTNKRVNKKI